jgi:predicted nucleic acid-binding protein
VEELVIDASSLVDVLTDEKESSFALAEKIAQANLFAPDHLYIESAQALKNLAVRLPAESIEKAFDQLRALDVQTVPFSVFCQIAWRHRHNLSLYDAGYLATAMITGNPLVTSDRKLATVAKDYCEVVEV